MAGTKRLNLLFRNTINFVIALSPLAFWQASADPFGPVQMSVIRIFVPFAAVVYFLSKRGESTLRFAKSPAFVPLALYLAMNLASVFVALNKQVSFKYFSELFVIITGAYFIAAISDKRDLKRLFVLMLSVHALMAVYGIMQHFEADPFKWSTNFGGRPLGTIGNPNFFAGQLLFPLFLFASLFFLGNGRKVLYSLGFSVTAVCLVFTKVAGVFFGAVMAAPVFVAGVIIAGPGFLKANKKAAAITLAALVVAAAVAAPFAYPKAESFVKSKKRSLVHRMLMWEASVLMAKDAPVLGKGIGNYRLNYPYYQGILLNDPRNNTYDYVVTWMPHQNYLLIAAETGVLGLGAFLAALFVLFRQAARRFVYEKKLDAYMFGAFSGTVALLAASFFNTFYNIASTSLYFFLFLFLISGRSGSFELQAKRYVLPLAAVAAVLLFFFAESDARLIASNFYLKKANKAAKEKNHALAIQLFNRVFELKPVELCPQTDVAQYYYAAESYRETGDIRRAEELYRKDLELNPYCPEVNNMLGAVTGQLGNIDDAVEKLKLAVFVAPHYQAAYTNLATAYIAKGDPASASKVLESFVEKNGENDEISALIRAADAIIKQAGKK